MKKTGRYETAVMAFVPENLAEWTTVHSELLNEAVEIDILIEKLVWESQRMAERFSACARSLKNRGTNGDCPTNYSTVNEIVRDAAQLEVKQRSLDMFVRNVLGREQAKEFTQLLNSYSESV